MTFAAAAGRISDQTGSAEPHVFGEIVVVKPKTPELGSGGEIVVVVVTV